MSSSSSAYTDQASALLRACKSKIIKVCKNQRQTIKPRLLALINEAKDPQQLLETLKPHVTARSKQLFEAAVEKCRMGSIESGENDPVGGLFSLLRIFNELANDIFAENILGEKSKASKRRPAVGEDALEEGWEELQDEEVEEVKDNLPEDLILHDLNKPQ